MAKTSSKKKKKLIIGLSIGAVIIVGGVLVGARFFMNRPAQAALQVMQAVATKGSIEKTVVGTGSLAAGETTTLELPSSLSVEETKVSAGDSVKAGDVLATLDSASLRSAIDSLKSEIATLDDKLSNTSETASSKTITSSAAGRIKQLYVAAGDDIGTVMAQHGALAVLSLDGKMKVTFTLADGQEAPALDASVKVQLPDGTTKSGTVAAISGSDITVTFSDNGPVPGETATVLSSDGATTYGQGEMAINRPLEVMGTDGTVSSVSVSVDSYVYSGSTLVTLTSKPASSDYESLYASRQEKAETLRTLLNYAQGNTVTAPVDGVVQSLPGGENTGFVLANADSIALTVNIDELDILSVAAGQKVRITLDALPDETFEGEITKVSDSGSAEQGVTTYPVTISITPSQEMKLGMNATATIVIDSRTDALLIPLDALQERGGEQFVYSYAEDGALGEMRTVATGLSDGTNVEITDGLSEGDVIAYMPTEDSSDEMEMMMPGGMMNFDPSSMPDMGGNMPDLGGGRGGSMPNMGGGPGGGQ